MKRTVPMQFYCMFSMCAGSRRLVRQLRSAAAAGAHTHHCCACASSSTHGTWCVFGDAGAGTAAHDRAAEHQVIKGGAALAYFVSVPLSSLVIIPLLTPFLLPFPPLFQPAEQRPCRSSHTRFTAPAVPKNRSAQHRTRALLSRG